MLNRLLTTPIVAGAMMAGALLFGGNPTATAQTVSVAKDPEAHAILDRMSKTYRGLKSYRMAFTMTTEEASGKDKGKPGKGSITVRQPSFRLHLPGMDIVSDGKTQWAYLASSGEVTITPYEPEPGEVTSGNLPELWRQGYKYAVMAQLRGEKGNVQIIDLEPEDISAPIAKLRLVIDRTAGTIRRWIVYERGTNARQTFDVTALEKNPALPPATFAPPMARYPKARVIDLR